MEPSTSTPIYTVLRIKRKATEAPLSSLVIQDDPSTRGIKKRRDVSGRARGVFRLAETVPDKWEGGPSQEAALKERIETLLARKSPSLAVGMGVSGETKSVKRQTESLTVPRVSQIPSSKSGSSMPGLKYRVVPPTSPRSRSMIPPKVLSIAEIEQARKALTFVDAEAVSGPTPAETAQGLKEDKEMEAFLPMLQEYLQLEQDTGTRTRSRSGPVRQEEYVYDLYYRDLRPSLSSTPLGLGLGDGVGIGALLGYSDISPTSSPESSEPEDEADEDSNDEDYYRNDYPEDEDADEDMQDFRDPYDESDQESAGSDRDRGQWEYR
ncbi:hypothetical protein BCR39DRAFT_591420 [Naematelia encephala]|uniref:Probable RNA polymerase II nuclear localization protein SLC7A6OS n=1 Tax=Naematelia encephala TaxID=71784 RepID=A0A1Y2AHF3_9TREE|nr:hypothetical protein BCR39DRAFT_591420 [Naematelia encephala]